MTEAGIASRVSEVLERGRGSLEFVRGRVRRFEPSADAYGAASRWGFPPLVLAAVVVLAVVPRAAASPRAVKL